MCKWQIDLDRNVACRVHMASDYVKYSHTILLTLGCIGLRGQLWTCCALNLGTSGSNHGLELGECMWSSTVEVIGILLNVILKTCKCYIFFTRTWSGAAAAFISYKCWKARSANRRTCATQGVSEGGCAPLGSRRFLHFQIKITPFQAIKFANLPILQTCIFSY